MRCVAQSGYWQVLDGIPVTRGIVARCLREGADQLVTVQADGEFIEAIPGLVAELAQPLRLEGRVRGVFSVESQRHLDPPTVLELRRIGAELQRTLDRVGLHLPDGALHRLARASSELTGLRTGLEVADTAVRLGAELSRTSSAALALPGEDGSHAVVASTGPLGPSLRATPPGPLGALVEELRDIASCTSSGTTAGEVNAAVATLRDTGAATLGLFPVRRDDGSTGLLVVADERPVELDLELRQALELLALSTGRALEHAAAVEALRRRAEIDPLTEVGSRAAFEDRLAELEAGDATGVSVLLVDLDRFKAVNDRYGHLVGDQVLADVARAMRGVLAEGEDVYRIGGDEFAVVVPQRTAASIDLLVERLGRECDRTLVPFGASASVGVARRRATEAMEACLQRADRQLYERKATARA